MDNVAPSEAVITWLFSRQCGLISGSIAWFGGGEYAHVDCELPDRTLLGSRSDAIGGKPAGVQIRPANYAKWVKTVRLVLPCTFYQQQTFHQFIKRQIGKPYDSAAIFGFILGRNWAAPDSYICSELQCSGLLAAGIVEYLYLTANRITPNDLTLIITALGGKILGGSP